MKFLFKQLNRFALTFKINDLYLQTMIGNISPNDHFRRVLDNSSWGLLTKA